jgi:hypothetical protein
MSGLVQPGEDVKYVLSEDVTAVSPYNRAFIYDTNENEVKLASEGDANFAGVLIAVQISRSSQQGYNTTAYAGDNCTLKKKGMMEVIGSGVIRPGMPVALDENGTFKELSEFYGTPTVEQVVLQVGVAETRCSGAGETFVIRFIGK